MSNHDKEFLIRVKADIKQAIDSLNAVAGNLKDVGTSGSSAGSAAAGGMDKATKATMTWHQFIKERMGPLMKKFAAEGKSHAETHTLAIRQIAAEWKQYKATGVKANTEVNKSTEKTTKLLDKLKTALVAYVSFRSAKAIIRQADAYKVLQQRIKTATKETGDYTRVSRELLDISRENGVQLEISVALFQGLARSAPELKATNAEMLKLTNLVEQLSVISGASKANTRAGLLQFSQGLAAGVFRAEEFNSLLENLPELANRIANGLSKTPGELRKAIIDGKVLSKDVFDALLKQAPEIAKEFEDIQTSLERASTSLGNSLARRISQLDDMLGTTQSIAEAMSFWSSALDGNPLINQGEQLKKYQTQLNHTIDRIKILKDFIGDGDDVSLADKVKAYLEFGAINISSVEKAEALLGKLLSKSKDTRAQIQKIINDLTAPDEGGNDLGGSDKKSIGISAEDEKKVKALTEALKQQSETFGQASEEIALYKLQLLGADEAQLKLAESFIASIKQQKEAVKVQTEVNRIINESKSEYEKYQDVLSRLSDLLNTNKLSQDEYNKAVVHAKDAFEKTKEAGTDAMKKLEAATRGWGDQFTNTLADMVQQGKLDFKSLADSIISDLLRIQIMQTITGPLFSALGIPGFSAGTNHTGGMAGTGAAKFVNPAVFLNAPRYHTGGIAGLKANEVPAILQKNEEVLTRDDPRHRYNQGGAQQVKVEIVKNGSPVQTQKAETSFNPEGMVVKVFLDDMNRGGPISNRLNSKIRNGN